MKIAFITKYPPIHGGTCAGKYWFIKKIAERGHEAHVITNAWEVEAAYRTDIYQEDLSEFQPPNVYVHSTNPFLNRGFIPYSNLYEVKLANLAIEVVRKYQCDVIDSTYILPYVLAGYHCKIFTNKPQIMRHASSDVNSLWLQPNYKTIFTEVLKNVDAIVTYKDYYTRFEEIGVSTSKIFLRNKNYFSMNAFSPKVKPFDLKNIFNNIKKGIFILTYFGKISKGKGTYRLIEALSKLRKENFILLFVVQYGNRLNYLLKEIEKYNLSEKVRIMRSVPPWRVPNIIAASTCIIKPEYNFPLPHFPKLPFEAMMMGKPIIITTDLKKKRTYSEVVDGENGFICEPRDLDAFANKIKNVLRTPREELKKIGKRACDTVRNVVFFDDVIDNEIELYKLVIERNSYAR